MSAQIEQITAHMSYLRALARSKTREHALADDLVQECMVRAIAKRASFRDGTNLKAWLSTILSNLFINETRRRQRWDSGLDPDHVIPNLTSGANQEHRQRLIEVDGFLRRIPADQREALHLIGVDGLSYEEASEVLEVPVGTVKSRVSRARQALRSQTGDTMPLAAAA